LLAVLALGALVATTASPAAASTCSDPVFENAALAALAQRNQAIGDAYAGDYASAKADVFIGWRVTIDARRPCNLQLRTLRKHLLGNLGALWLSYAAMAAGDLTDGLAFLVAASKEAVLANAAVASLVSTRRVTGAVTRAQPRLS
jgi:hypothetical protein